MDELNKCVIDKNLTSFVLRVCKYVEQFKKEGFLVTAGLATFEGGVYRQEIKGERLSLHEKPFVNDIVEEHKLCKDVVLDVLENVPFARENDLFLILEVWRRQGVDIDLTDEQFSLLFNPESVRRSRQKIQNEEGLFLPVSFGVAVKRRFNADLLRSHYGGVALTDSLTQKVYWFKSPLEAEGFSDSHKRPFDLIGVFND